MLIGVNSTMSTNTSTPTGGQVISLRKPKKGSARKAKEKVEKKRHNVADYTVKNRPAKLTPAQVRNWEPTPEQRYAVRCMAASGVGQEVIARAVHPLGPISTSTLRRFFRDELDNGKALLIRDVTAVATQMALSGNHPSMTKFWLIVHAGWNTGEGGGLGSGKQKFGTQDASTEDVMKRLQNSAKYMAETLPNMPSEKTGTD